MNDAEIWGNTITNYATTGTTYQDAGIILNPGFKGKVFNNFVSTSPAGSIGILYHGNGDTEIFNNVIIAGLLTCQNYILYLYTDHFFLHPSHECKPKLLPYM